MESGPILIMVRILGTHLPFGSAGMPSREADLHSQLSWHEQALRPSLLVKVVAVEVDRANSAQREFKQSISHACALKSFG